MVSYNPFLIKKAQSGVIVIILIILIAIFGVLIFWNVINALISDQSKNVNIHSYSLDFGIKDAALDITGASRISIDRKAGEGQLDSLKFMFYDNDGNSHSEIVNDNLPDQLEEKTYYFSQFSDIGKIYKVSVIPIIKGNLGREVYTDVPKDLAVPMNLLIFFKFDEDILDSVGDSVCREIGNIYLQENDGKKSAYFNSDKLECKNKKIIGTEDFAFSFWFKDNKKSSDLLNFGDSSSFYKISISELGEIVVSYGYYGNVIVQKSMSMGLFDDKWHHVTVTDNLIYIDGKLDSSINLNNKANPVISEDFIIQGNDIYLDEVMVFNSSLSSEQVKFLFKQ